MVRKDPDEGTESISEKKIFRIFFKLLKKTTFENFMKCLKDNSTMYKTEAQIVSYGSLYLNPSSHQCQPSYKKYIAV